MNFSTPSKVQEQVEVLKQAELSRAPARALVDLLFNGDPPWSEKEAEENHIHLNANFGEGTDLLLQSRQQLENALLTTGNFATVKLPDAPPSKREQYQNSITNNANRALKKSLKYLHTERQKIGSMVLHGPGPQMWQDDENPLPYFVAIPDLLISTDTDITLCDCMYFFVRRQFTPGALFRKTIGAGKHVNQGWNLWAVKRILNSYKDLNQNPNNYDWYNQPEAMQEIYKQNLLWFEQDTAPKIWAWDCYWQEDDQENESWQRAMILDTEAVAGEAFKTNGDPVPWLFRSGYGFEDDGKATAIEGCGAFADNINQILHVNFVDGNNVPPFMYHSCRGVGLRLYDAVQIRNRLMCQFLEKVFEDMKLIFRVNDPADKGRLNEIFMGFLYGAIPSGLDMLKRDERYEIDANLVEMAGNFLKQNMGEGSASYTQQLGLDDRKERTALEVNAMLSQATKVTSGMINLAYLQEDFAYAEIFRRLAKPGTGNFMAKHFQAMCKEDGVPDKWMQSERWDVSCERVMGGGSSQIELAQATALFQARSAFNPKGQAVAANKYVFAITHDPKVVQEIAPLDQSASVSHTQHDTEMAFGVLMDGYPLRPVDELNPLEVCGTIIPLMEAAAKNILQSGGVGTQQQVAGLINCQKYVAFYLNILSQDKANNAAVKQFKDRLGNVANETKGFIQRQRQAAQAQAQKNGGPGIDPEKAAELQFKQASDQQKLKNKEQTHRQKLAHKQQDFQSTQQQKKLQALNEIGIKSAEAASKPKDAYNRVRSRSDE